MSERSGSSDGTPSDGAPDHDDTAGRTAGPVYGESPRYGYQQSEFPPPAQPGPPPTSELPPQSQPYPQGPSQPWGQEPYRPANEQQPYQQPYQQQPYQQPYQQQPYPPAPIGQPGYPPAMAQPYVPVYPYSRWIRRVGAFLIDFAPSYIALIPFYIGYFLYLSIAIQLASDSTSRIDPTPSLIWMGVGSVLLLAAFGWQIYNRWVVAGRTGQSMGKRVLKLHLLAEATGQPIGVLNAFLRDIVHILDGIAYIGYLWPLWDDKRQTFADKLMKTVVADSIAPAQQPAPTA